MTLTKWNNTFLKEKSKLIDPLADNLVSEMINNHGQEAIKDLFTQLTDNNDIISNPKVKPEIKNYFNKNQTLPDWADKNKIKIGQNLFELYGLEIAFLLNFRSLPLCYSSKSGAKVLYSTGRLSNQGQNTNKLTKRLMETSQMLINVMSPGGFDLNGTGIITIKKVRLLHASIRFYLKHPHINKNGWNVEELGEPINQEEMAGTLMAFGPLILKGLAELGIEITKEQENAYTHCWNVVGYFIGVNSDLMPNSYEDGWDLGIAILKRNKQESIEGKELSKSLVQFGKNIFPGYFFDDMPEFFIKRFTRDVSMEFDDNLSELIGINPLPTFKRRFITRILTYIFDKVSDVQRKSWFFRGISKWINKKLMQGMINFYLKDKKVEFNIPPSLRENWNL